MEGLLGSFDFPLAKILIKGGSTVFSQPAFDHFVEQNTFIVSFRD